MKLASKTLLCLAGTLMLGGLNLPRAQAAEKPRIEIAFVLDTTGSMGGLIEGAKKKIWSIVNEIVDAKPRPEIEVGFVAYRDKGDAYVTQTHDLTPDLDQSFDILSKFQADGGGDTPEHVNAGLDDAVRKLSWSPAGSGHNNLYQVIFLVGDCPPHMDYQDGLDYKKSVAKAAAKGIFVNAIRCGNDPDTEKYWLDIAKRGNGSYFSLAQDGGTVDINTPYDAEILRLGGALEQTTVARRGLEYRQKASADSYAAAAAAPEKENAMARSTFNAKSAQVYGNFDIVTEVMNGRKVSSFKDSELNDDLRKMTPARREQYINNKVAQRKTVQTKLNTLEQKRNSFIQAELKKQGAKGLDQKLVATIQTQANKRGFKY